MTKPRIQIGAEPAMSLEYSLVPPDATASSNCPICFACRTPTDPICGTCSVATNELGALTPIVPISLYARPSILRDMLSFYKPGRETFEPSYGSLLAEVVARFMWFHGQALQKYLGGWTDATVVPSTHRSTRHPLEFVADRAGLATTANLVESSGKRGVHRVYDRELFRADKRKVGGARVLLIEDVYVSGARSQSASIALRDAGATVAGVVAIGRRINPSHDAISSEYWDQQRRAARPLSDSHEWLHGNAR